MPRPAAAAAPTTTPFPSRPSRRRRAAGTAAVIAATALAARPAPAAARPAAQAGAPPTIAGCPMFPADNIWNTPVDELPVHPRSAAWVRAIGADGRLKADFGSGTWNGGPIGIPFVVVDGRQPRVPVTFEYADESDPGPYPIPPDAPIEGGPRASGDRHILVLDRDACRLYETWSTYPNADGSWRAGSGAIFDLRSHALRPDGWTSADAAGLPILPGLVRYDEVAAGEIAHAIRFTVPATQRLYLWPARHFASRSTDAGLPPMGLRMRLKADFDIAGYPPPLQVILRALKRYGMINADNGSAWFLSGVPDPRWDDDMLQLLRRIPGSAFEAVDAAGLMLDRDSGQVRPRTGPPDTPPTALPTATPTDEPTAVPTDEPTAAPTSAEPTPAPTAGPTATAGPPPTAGPAGVAGRAYLPAAWRAARR